ncbi:MAG: guanylate kinase [Bacteroidota bacterium]
MTGISVQKRCVIISAPSGAGKTTIVHHLLKSGLKLEFSISATSRKLRDGEADGFDYYFLSAEDFREKINAGEFMEWEEVYPGSYYGTLRSELDRIWNNGHFVLFEVDVFGGLKLKKVFGDHALSLFIMPPSINALEERLRKRSTDSEESMKKRIAKAKEEMDHSHLFDKIVINDKLEDALSASFQVVNTFLNS